MSLPVLDPDLLKAFVAVAEHGSFTRAAAVLHRTQSAVSMKIKRLEQQLGVELLVRNRATIELSSAGEGLMGYARQLLALGQEAVERIRAREEDGVIRLGIMNDYGTLVIPPVLAVFLRSFPKVRIEMETGLTPAILRRLGTDFDLVIAMHAAGTDEGQFLRREQAVWAGQPDQSLSSLDPVGLALFPSDCLFRRWAIEALDRVSRRWRLLFVSSNLTAVESVAAQGLAITVVKAGAFPISLRPLSGQFGLPPLPAAEIRLHRAPQLSGTGALFANHLVSSLAVPLPDHDKMSPTPRRHIR